MKIQIKNILGMAAVALGAPLLLTGCDDFIDAQPESSFSSEEIFSSEEDTKAMLNTIYTKLCHNYLYGFSWPYTFRTNTDVEMRSSSTEITNAAGSDIEFFEPLPSWTSLERTWTAAYTAINYCNDFLENMEQSPLFSHIKEGETPTNMQQMYGEVKCLRAMIYLDLVRTWGDVVFTLKATTATDDFYGETVTDRSIILSTLIEDLKTAEPYMLYAADMSEGVERAGREFCQSLIGQLALYRGGWSLRPEGGAYGTMMRENDWEDYYRIAQEYLGKVISENKHSLDRESFEQMWLNEMNYTVLNDGDVIFEIPELADASSSSNLGYQVGFTIAYDSNNPSHPYGQCSNYSTYCGLYPFTFDQRDLRLDVTCVPYQYDVDLNQIWGGGSKCVTGWGVGKFNKMKMGTPPSGYQGNTGINSIRMRYADVLLMYAEVVNELSGPAGAKEARKQVRRRAFAPELWAECVDQYVDRLSDPESFFQAIVDERAWEFGGEGIRKYDLARWNLYGKVIKQTYDKFVDWAKRAAANEVSEVRGTVFYRELPDPANPSRIVLEFKGLKEYGDNIGDHPFSEGWKYSQDYAKSWWARNSETDEYEIIDDLKWSFRGFINYSNASSVGENDPVRYLCPYPSRVITAHRGSMKQYYGFH